MTVFPIVAGLLLACAMAFILVPLTRVRRTSAGTTRVTHDSVNVSVYRDQLRELGADLAAGTITQERHDEAVREIERRLLDDTGTASGAIERDAGELRGAGRAALFVGMAVPFFAAVLYFMVGTPQALLLPAHTAAPGGEAEAHGPDEQQVQAMIERLAARLQAEPGNAQGWAMLARSYAVLGRFGEAAAAYAKLIALVPDDAQLLADYADVLAMSQGRRLEGEPEKIVAKALSIDPNNVKALALAGSAAMARRDFKSAIAYWERLVRVAPPGSELADATRASIQEAKARAAGLEAPAAAGAPGAAGVASAGAPGAGVTPPRAPAGSGEPQGAPPARAAAPGLPAAGVAPAGASVSGIVEIAPEVAAKIAPTDTLFVFARAAEGSRMPVAIMRAQAKDLPLRFTLDDRSSMMAGAKLSDQKTVIVGARVSKSGSATPQPGDLQGYSAPVAPGASGLRIVLSESPK